MDQPQRSKDTKKTNTKPILSKKNSLQRNKIINDYRKEVSKMNYEDCLEAFESILSNLQKDGVPLDQIQNLYLKGNIYLKHCEKLLKKVENEVIEINLLDPED